MFVLRQIPLDSSKYRSFSFAVIGPTPPLPQLPPVDLAHRRQVRRRAGQETLVGGIKFIPVDQPFLDLQAQFVFRQGDHRIAGYAVQNAGIGRRRHQFAVFDQKQVLAGTLGHVAVRRQHDALIEAVLDSLGLGQGVVDIQSRRFDARREDIIIRASPAGNGQAAGVGVQVAAPRNGKDQEIGLFRSCSRTPRASLDL